MEAVASTIKLHQRTLDQDIEQFIDLFVVR